MSTTINGQESAPFDTNIQIEHNNYDVIVIGAGPGGYSTALRSAQLGAHVALVERDAVVGGTCLNRGCIPTKALITATSAISQNNHARQLGIHSTFEGIDYKKLNQYKHSTVDAMTSGLRELLIQRQVDIIYGQARLLNSHTVEVSDTHGQNQILNAKDIVLATGAHPTPLQDYKFSEHILDSDRALELSEFPTHPLIVGSGAIAIEFASIWQAAGAHVSLLIRKDRVLSNWDRRTSMTLTRELSKQGINIITHAQCAKITQEHEELCVSYTSTNTDSHMPEQHIKADKVLVAIGRTPNTEASWFAELAIDTDSQGLVHTDAWGRTSCKNVWALGDITPGYHFAHRAFEQGIVVAESINGLHPTPVNEDTIPQVVFSTPQAASVGLTKQKAQTSTELCDIEETAYPMQANARIRMSGSGGCLSIVTACRKNKPDVRIVVGVHTVAPEAAELIAEAEQIVGNATPLAEAARLIHPHPTFSETLGEALLKADKRPLHMR